MRVCVNSVKRQTLQGYVICQQFVFVGRNQRGKYVWSNSLVYKITKICTIWWNTYYTAKMQNTKSLSVPHNSPLSLSFSFYFSCTQILPKICTSLGIDTVPCQHIVHLPTHPPTSPPLTLQLNTTVYLTTFNHICKSSVVYAMTTILVFLNKEIFINLWKHNLKALFKTPLKLGSCRKNINDIVIVC